MKRRIFINVTEHGTPCHGAAGKGRGQTGKNGRAAVWLTDDSREAQELVRSGECTVFVLTEKNREEFPGCVRYCAEAYNVREWQLDFPETDVSAEAYGQNCAACPEWLDSGWLLRTWQRHAGIPWHILDTRRLSVREIEESDRDWLGSLYADSETRRFMDERDILCDAPADRLKSYIANMYGFYGFGMWIAVDRVLGEAVGLAGFCIREGRAEPELGFAVAAPFRGRGYAREACRAVLSYGFEELSFPAVRTVVHRENEKSLRLCEKLGFHVDKETETGGKMWIELRMERKSAGNYKQFTSVLIQDTGTILPK